MAKKKKKMTKKKKSFLKRIITLLVILLILFIAFLLIPTPEPVELNADGSVKINNLELPTPIPGEQVIKHTGYTLSYNEEYEQPSWVAYELTRDEVLGDQARKDDFRADPAVKTGSATPADYKKSGYDRGHLAPAADFKWSPEAMNDTFFMSNMSPQTGDFNRGIWADLEAMVRVNAFLSDSLYVVTGPVLTDGPYKTIGENEVAVPNYYYKVLLDYTEPEVKAIGFILPNEKGKKKMPSYAVSIDKVEEVTGIDFFPLLPDDVEDVLEAEFDTNLWSFSQTLPDADSLERGEVAYVMDNKTRIKNLIFEYIGEIKYEVFKYLGLLDIAKEFGLV